MPPDTSKTKKHAKSKKSTAGPKSVNAADYVRERTEIPELEHVLPLLSKKHGKVFNVEELFPEWNVADEVWTDSVYETATEPEYPAHIEIAEYKTVKDILGISGYAVEEDSGKKKPGNNRRGSLSKNPEVANHFGDEHIQDEKGRLLPRMVLDKSSKMKGLSDDQEVNNGLYIVWPFLSSLESQSANYQRPESPSRKSPAHEAAEIKEFASENYRDPLLCSAFVLVERFAPGILSIQKDSFPFLWRAIYPKTRTDRSCYNPSGKYCVKLFLGGKWRKITVSDLLPVASDGRPALAASSEYYELWPSILAKAIYTVYTVCGYSKTFHSVGVHSKEPEASKKSAAFIAFAVHLLTGWLPSQPWSLSETAEYDAARLEGVLQEMIFGGVVKMSVDDIPDHNPLLRQNHDDNLRDRKFTKKQLKAEMNRKLEEKKLLMKAINARELQIEKLDTAICKSFSEWFFICFHTAESQDIIVLPVLGMSYTTTSDFENTLLLVHWVVHDPVEQVPQSENSIEAGGLVPSSTPIDCEWISISDLRKLNAYVVGVDTKTRVEHKLDHGWHWIPSSPVEEEGKKKGKGKEAAVTQKDKIKLKQDAMTASSETLVERDSFPPTFLKIDTTLFRSNEIFIKALNRKASSKMSSKAVGGNSSVTGLSAKGTPDASMILLTDEAIEAQRAAFAEIDLNRAASSGGGGYRDVDLRSQMSTEEDGDGMTTSRSSNVPLSGQDSNLCPYLDSRLLKKKKHYLSITMFLHADIIALSNHPPGTAGGGVGDHTANSGHHTAPGTPSQQHHQHQQQHHSTHQPDTHTQEQVEVKEYLQPEGVLILQEMKTDGEDPLILRIQLGNTNRTYLPMNRVTFHIPADRITSKPIIFWVRLFTSSSLYFSVHCGAPVVVGPAEQIWESIGGKAVIYSGETAATPAGMERLFFRTSVQGVDERPTKDEGENDDDVFPGNNEDMSVSFLMIQNTDIIPYVSLLVQNEPSKNMMSLPLLGGNLIPVTARSSKSLFARCFHPSANIPEFSWKFLLLHHDPLTPVTIPPQVNMLQRYQGLYRPNNRLMLFKDVMKVDIHSFPIAIRFSIQSLPDSPEVSSNLNIEEDIWLTMRTYRKSDRKLISVYNGKGMIQIYKLDETGFLPDPVIPEESPDHHHHHHHDHKGKSGAGSKTPVPTNTKHTAAAAPPTKKEEKPKKGKGDNTECLEVLIECQMDEKAMEIPEEWRSRIPFEFSTIHRASNGVILDDDMKSEVDPDFSKSIPGNSTVRHHSHHVDPQFIWSLDILAGHVLGLSHDTYDLERLAALKNSWETAHEGREEQAIASVAYISEVRRISAESSLILRPDSPTGTDGGTDVPTSSPQPERERGRGKSRGKTPTAKKSSHSPSKHRGDHAQSEVPQDPMETAYQFLASALKKEVEVVKKREDILRTLPHYIEHVESIPVGGQVRLVTPEELEKKKTARILDVEESQRLASESVDRLIKYNDALRLSTKAEILGLSEVATNNVDAIRKAWMLREKYKAYADTKNSTLKWLLNKSTECLDMITDDGVVVNVKDKAGKGGKGKDSKVKKK